MSTGNINLDILLHQIKVDAIAKTDANENKMLDKSKARFRIDPAAAMIISHTLARIDNGEIDINQHIMSEGFGF